MKRNSLLTISAIVLLTSCNLQSDKEPEKPDKTIHASKEELTQTASAPIKSKGKSITIGYYDTYEKLPGLVFDSISEVEFNRLKAKKNLTRIKTQQKGNDFFIPTATRKHSFRIYKDYDEPESWSGFELKGYYPKLKLFALTENSTSEHLGFGELFLLDSITDYRYILSSFGDGSVETPIPSINGEYLVYYYNGVYDHGVADIGVLKVNDKTKPDSYLKEHAFFHASDFGVEEIRWKSDHCFYIKGYHETYNGSEWVKEYCYYQTTFK